MSKNVSPRVYWGAGETALHKAARDNDPSSTKKLLVQGANVNARDSHDRTPLHLASASNLNDDHLEVIGLLLRNGADVNARNGNGETALHRLAWRSNVKVVDLILKSGADVNAKTLEGESALLKAIRYENVEVVRLLVKNGADVNEVSGGDGSTPLHDACLDHRNKKIIKILLKAGVDANAMDHNGRTPLMYFLEMVYPVAISTIPFLLRHSDVNTEGSKVENLLRYSPSSLVWKIVLQHVAKTQAAGVTVNPELMQLISDRREFEDYFQKCNEELMLAKSTRVKNSWVNFFDLLVGCRKKMKNYAGNRDSMRDFENRCLESFPTYGAEMQKNVVNGLKVRKLFNESTVLLSDCLPIFNSNHLIVRDILDCVLSKKRLIKFNRRESKLVSPNANLRKRLASK